VSDVEIYRALNRLARSRHRPFDEILNLYTMERILGRLVKTPFAARFVLKGGMLLAAYGMRRPTRDIDTEAVDFALDEAHIRTVLEAVAEVAAEDGLAIDATSISFAVIRDQHHYSGLRASLTARIHTARVPVRLDVSTGDPIVPDPQIVVLPGLLGADVEIAGYPPELVVAEKAVTILQRGTTSTRWRDFMDLRNFARTSTFDAGRLIESIESVAASRQVSLRPLEEAVVGYADAAQTLWSAWRRKVGVENESRPDFADQIDDVLAFVGPLFSGQVRSGTWDPDSSAWAVTAETPVGKTSAAGT
jgi:hypothetical protein